MAKYAAVAEAGKLADKQLSILRKALESREARTSSHDKASKSSSDQSDKKQKKESLP